MKLKYGVGGVQEKGRRKKVIFAVIGVLVVLLIGVRVTGGMKEAALKKAAEANRQTYTPVEIQTVEKQDLSTTITLSGKVKADKEAPVMAKTPGKVAAIHSKVGDVVKKDQVLFSLDKTDMMTSYHQAEAVYQMARASYETNMANYENGLKNLERMKQLYEAGAISKVELDQAELLASDASRKAIEGQLAQAQAAYDSVVKTLNDMDVKSPIDGILTALNVNVGGLVSNAAAAGTVVDMGKVYVTVSVSEKEINNIKQGQEVEVQIPSSSYKGTGVIEELSLAADYQGKYSLKTSLQNKEGIVKPGMFANITVSTAVKKDVVAVSTDAVILHNGKNVVFVAQDGVAVEKEVTVGLENGSESEIVKGLEPGELVVLKGQHFLTNGTQIKVVVQDGMEAQNSEVI